MNDAKTKAIGMIRDEHRSIAAVLSALRELAKTAQDPAVRTQFSVLHAMIHYIDAFPERLHHPKEEEYLFRPLARESAPGAPAVGDPAGAARGRRPADPGSAARATSLRDFLAAGRLAIP